MCALPACDREQQVGGEGANASLFNQLFAQSEEERPQKVINMRDADLDRELEEARRQLQIALEALGEEGVVAEEETVAVREEVAAGVEEGSGEDSGSGDAADTPSEDAESGGVPGAGRAIIVEEDPPGIGHELALRNAVPVALLDSGDHQIFFVELSRFGDWFETSEYGFVWQPADLRTDPAWRPYTRGRWVHSDQGWTWLSDEPFGWAVYHYGRWVLLADQGWVWVPGDDWAPAWVSWRQNDDYLGWAPLPPETLYDDTYDYDPGIDLAYDVAPDCYNFVPVDHFYEPVQSYCVPRVRVTTIVINTRNVTRFSMHERRVHCGGPDFAWVNRHCRRPARPCRLNFGNAHDHFVHRHRHRLHDDALHVFAPAVKAPWNAAVCPGRVAGNLGRVDVVRAGKGQMKRDLVVRHQRAALRRHEAAREAVATRECQVALRQNMQRQQAGREAQLAERPLDEVRQRRAEVENGLRAASAAVAAAERRMREGKLNPRERAEAKRSIHKVQDELAQARETLNARMAGRGPLSSKTQAEKPLSVGQKPRRAGEQPGEEGPRSAAEGESRRAAVAALQEQKRALAEARAIEGKEKREVEDELNARQQAVSQRAAQQAEERRRMAENASAGERLPKEVVESKRQEEERLQIARERKQEVSQAVVEGNRQRGVLSEEEAARRVQAAKKVEERRQRETAQQKTEESRQQALVQEKAEEAKREALVRQKALEAKQQALLQQKAEESRKRALAQQKAEEAKRAALVRQKAAEAEAKQRALLQQRAEESRQRALAQQKAEEAKRAALVRLKALEAKQRAEYEARRRAQVEARRREVEERARADAQRRAATEQAKARAEMQRRAELEARRRAVAEQARRQAKVERAAAEAKARAASRGKTEASKSRSTKRR